MYSQLRHLRHLRTELERQPGVPAVGREGQVTRAAAGRQRQAGRLVQAERPLALGRVVAVGDQLVGAQVADPQPLAVRGEQRLVHMCALLAWCAPLGWCLASWVTGSGSPASPSGMTASWPPGLAREP